MSTACRDVCVSVVIVSWNTRDLVARCLDSLTCDTPGRDEAGVLGRVSAEVILVDNASTDGTAHLVRQRYQQVRMIANDANVGFAVACNQGIRLATGRYVLLLNPDAELDPATLDRLVQFMEDHLAIGVAAPMLVDSDGQFQVSCSPQPTLRRELWRMFHLDAVRPYALYPMQSWPTDRARHVDVAQGACLLLRREALEQVGLLDERFFMYSEEVDLCLRLREYGWGICWVPQARVLHHGGQSTQQAAETMFLHLYQSKMLYFRKHGGASAAQRYKLILALAALGRLLVSPLIRVESPERRDRHRTLTRHYGRLLRALPGL